VVVRVRPRPGRGQSHSQAGRLTTDNKVYVSNMVTNTFVTYGMCVVPYPRAWLMDLQHITLTTIKQSMQVPTNADDDKILAKITTKIPQSFVTSHFK